MAVHSDMLDARLLNDWQRDLPLVPRPFAEIAAALDSDEADVIARLQRLTEAGAICRVGATIRPNTAGASTLAAVAAPDWRVEEVAALINAVPGVNHSYLRENDWNIWFVATGPDRAHVDAALDRVARDTGLKVLDLRLIRPFNIDLGFSLNGNGQTHGGAVTADATCLREDDRPVLQALSEGLPLVARPFAAVADRLHRAEGEIIARVTQLAKAGILSRVGIIVRHRALGWRSNAMVVWQVPEDRVEAAGLALAALPGVTLCYQRSPVPGLWPYTLYCMIHARSRGEAREVLSRAETLPELTDIPHDVLFSVRCFRQTGALITRPEAAA